MDKPYHPPRLRVALVREREAPEFPAKILRSSADVIHAFAFLRERDREEFWVAALDGKHRIIATHQMSLLGVRVLDHIIIGTDRAFSFCDEGLLPAPSRFPC